jgi:hypothetical protein
MRTVSTATAERMRLVGQRCEISDFADTTAHNWESTLSGFLANANYTAELRAGISFLVVNGAYPARVEFEPIRSLVACRSRPNTTTASGCARHQRRQLPTPREIPRSPCRPGSR